MKFLCRIHLAEGTLELFLEKILVILCIQGCPQHREIARIPELILLRHQGAYRPRIQGLAVLSCRYV
jgi:hypothetical protein